MSGITIRDSSSRLRRRKRPVRLERGCQPGRSSGDAVKYFLDDRISPLLVHPKAPASPAGVFNLPGAAVCGDASAGARRGPPAIRRSGPGRSSPNSPRQYACRQDRFIPYELSIDAHRAAEAAADIERRLDDGVAGEARRDRLEIGDFPGRGAAGHSVPPRQVRCGAKKSSTYGGTKRSRLHVRCMRKRDVSNAA
jgi:hypothetical protein